MIKQLITILKLLLAVLPFALFALLNIKANLKKTDRCKQFLMPLFALAYCIILLLFMNKLSNLVFELINLVPQAFEALGNWVNGIMDGKLAAVGAFFLKTGKTITAAMSKAKVNNTTALIMMYVFSALFMLVHIILKRIAITFMKARYNNKPDALEKYVSRFYEYDQEKNEWYIKPDFGQARSLLATLYITALIVSCIAMIAAAYLYKAKMLTAPFYPVFGMIILGEVYFFLGGRTREEENPELEADTGDDNKVCDYTMLRKVYRKIFPDKLNAEGTNTFSVFEGGLTNDELFKEIESKEKPMAIAYSRFMQAKVMDGLKLDQTYMMSGLELLEGRSILFNNPFYNDLIPYIFYPLNRELLHGGKVLIVLGRHDVEDDVLRWCEEGLMSVTGVPQLWRTKVLDENNSEFDIGIISRSSVHNMNVHMANEPFLENVTFMILLEPSRLVTTAQVGLNLLVRSCRGSGRRRITYCSCDKNCDGLVDALSHILMTSITEVSATERAMGVSSYMCWQADSDKLQHRLLPNISRYLGFGTELSFAALKNQVDTVEWYGGDAFPVVDMHWIAKQYYYDLLKYANLPVNQKSFDDHFKVSHNVWNAAHRENHFLTVEDESFNLFEVKRTFATRATGQGFVNVISSNYLLKDYMTGNEGIFDVDAKAIPYIAADYAHTPRNVALRLALRLCSGALTEAELKRELMLIDAEPADDPKLALWNQICRCYTSCCSEPVCDENGNFILEFEDNGKKTDLRIEIIEKKRSISTKTARFETFYSINDEAFRSLLYRDLCSAEYIAEDEHSDSLFLGTELCGHIFQTHLPGQFFTFGGKHYEMLKLTSDGRIMVRRAADHISGRPCYRQKRRYFIQNAVASETMGDCVDISGMKVSKLYADIWVMTDGYFEMKEYNDFNSAYEINVNGIPDRHYLNKQILRIDLPDVERGVCRTLTLLINEVFRTMFAENQAFIVAVCNGDVDVPLTYALDDNVGNDNSIYIIEDSQLDIGLLVAVRRNIRRILATICDYLDWHLETLDAVLNPPPEPAAVPTAETEVKDADEDENGGKPKNKNFFKRIFGAIGGFFMKLFGGKKSSSDGDTPEPAEGTSSGGETAEQAPSKPEKKPGIFKRLFGRKKKTEAEHGQEASPEETEPVGEVEAAINVEPKQDAGDEDPAEEESELDIADEEFTDSETEPFTDDEETGDYEPDEETAATDDEDAGEKPTMNSDFGMTLFNRAGEVPNDDKEITADEPETAEPVTEANEPPKEPDQGIEFEENDAHKPEGAFEKESYDKCYYLLYGCDSMFESLKLDETLAFLKKLGFGDSELNQARKHRNAAAMLEGEYDPNAPGKRFCDFCGCELIGTEYELLDDGRERCMVCSRTAIKSEKEFANLYNDVLRKMRSFYGITIDKGVSIHMVNSKRLHGQLGKKFIPTSKPDARTLGFARKEGKGRYSIYLENGAPRLASTMTMVHELTHIWQYLNWDTKKIRKEYGKEGELEVYEGMAKWSEIQYAYLIGEFSTAKREEVYTRSRNDEYGRGFLRFAAEYPLSEKTVLHGNTPFDTTDISV